MQYRNLNLDKLQAFAPERKLIDKENIYNAFGAWRRFTKGADAYTLSKIYQLSPDEQQRKMAEYRAYKGDFSGFDNIEQAKLRQAEMNALKEQQRADKENENAIIQRDKERSYNALRREHDVLTNELLNNMNKFNRENPNSPYRDINNKNVQLKFLQEQDTGLLQRFLTNLTEKEKLEYKPEIVRAKAEDIFGLEKSDRAETKTAETKTDSTEDVEEKSKESRSFVVDKNFSFDTDKAKEEYIFNDNWKASKDGLTDTQKKTLKDYVLTKFVNFNGRIISDDLTKNEKEKLSDIGLSFITKAEVDASRERAKVNKNNETIAKRLEDKGFPKPMANESNEDYIKRMEEKFKNDKQFYAELTKIINSVINQQGN